MKIYKWIKKIIKLSVVTLLTRNYYLDDDLKIKKFDTGDNFSGGRIEYGDNAPNFWTQKVLLPGEVIVVNPENDYSKLYICAICLKQIKSLETACCMPMYTFGNCSIKIKSINECEVLYGLYSQGGSFIMNVIETVN